MTKRLGKPKPLSRVGTKRSLADPVLERALEERSQRLVERNLAQPSLPRARALKQELRPRKLLPKGGPRVRAVKQKSVPTPTRMDSLKTLRPVLPAVGRVASSPHAAVAADGVAQLPNQSPPVPRMEMPPQTERTKSQRLPSQLKKPNQLFLPCSQWPLSRWIARGPRTRKIIVALHVEIVNNRRSRICLTRDRRYSFRSPRSQSQRRVPASLPTSHCRAASLSTCLPSSMWAYHGK